MDRRLLLAAAALIALAAAPAAHAKTRTVTCVGGADDCTATVKLAGLKKGDKVAINLTDTDLALRSITPSGNPVRAAYGLERLSTRLGGSQFVAQFLIFPPVPRTSSVRFRFAVPPKMTACGDDQFTIADAKVRINDIETHGAGCMAARRVAESCVNGTGPGRGWVPVQVDDTVILWRGQRRVTFDTAGVPATCVPSG
jgi:hypothetical protein